MYEERNVIISVPKATVEHGIAVVDLHLRDGTAEHGSANVDTRVVNCANSFSRWDSFRQPSGPGADKAHIQPDDGTGNWFDTARTRGKKRDSAA